MQEVQALENENKVLRWGGLAGVLGGALFILVFVIVGVFVGAAAADPREAVMRFPDIKTARTIENGLYLVVLILWVAHFLALYRAVRTSLAPALFGSVLGIVGLTVLAAGALPHVATVPVSNLYHAPGVTPDDQATLLIHVGMIRRGFTLGMTDNPWVSAAVRAGASPKRSPPE